ncbi:UNKNOWN [Stylonychia lemnae]|uniref:Uncharacterized protein n=1 Tax=Stylonychia lemnae TaxID=5949 RepID=A0A078ACS9_STYLE|nr:UNKNOWN [Stylonychia lemnae]|eukprot:CDW79994.1 UNKNOWN [Stylonychia lemnae]
MVRQYVQVTDVQRRELVRLIHEDGFSIAKASKITNIPYDNAKAINRTYLREKRIHKINYRLRYQKKTLQVIPNLQESLIINTQNSTSQMSINELSKIQNESYEINSQAENPLKSSNDNILSVQSTQNPQNNATFNQAKQPFNTQTQPSRAPLTTLQMRNFLLQLLIQRQQMQQLNNFRQNLFNSYGSVNTQQGIPQTFDFQSYSKRIQERVIQQQQSQIQEPSQQANHPQQPQKSIFNLQPFNMNSCHQGNGMQQPSVQTIVKIIKPKPQYVIMSNLDQNQSQQPRYFKPQVIQLDSLNQQQRLEQISAPSTHQFTGNNQDMQ